MPVKRIKISENSIISMLKGIPDDILADIFMKTLVKGDSSPLGNEEKNALKKAKKEKECGDTINWQNIR
jgi:hypothetical protein